MKKLPVSFEFFPPKTPEGAEKLRVVRQQLYTQAPEFCSVTYGAGGSTQEGTFGTVSEILKEGVSAASHFSCIGASKESVRKELGILKSMGVKRLVALRGDLPSGYGMGGEFHYASDLVAFIRKETGDDFHIEVAAYPEVHPQAKSPESDLQAYVAKVKAGANSAITQYFLQHRCVLPLCGRCVQTGRRRTRGARHHAHYQLYSIAEIFRRQWR
jgi:methylenetetrahydrofolate reductase (NADPH)